ncbi:hypothetical protein BDP81DRAFT_431928 [Colletotrichum phormii]|uniref:Uncharacterized protein n=1 Tax=Colletotrichum phormii TaxID=359342 RepID=A0AAJ0EF55_9PEZI|nr:uncharacterized protein BDP81DRAFT_431928 [Colletotrichum phormii]KAK1634751.1 hypothetical protein BDP81DRAFT_431928 [Colletotrichum phormii]
MHNGKKRGLLYCAYRRAHRAASPHSDPARYHDQINLNSECVSLEVEPYWREREREKMALPD